MHQRMRRAVVLTGILVLLATSLPGCILGKQSVGEFFKYRYEDMMEILELGYTTSETSQFAFYIDCLGSWPIGYGHVEGTYHGPGFGGWTSRPHYQYSIGYFVWGYEVSGWDDYDKTKPETLNTQTTGVVGTFFGPEGLPQVLSNSDRAPRPSYFPGCVHYWHFGRIGLLWNIRYTEIVDFLAGLVFLDPWGDDGKKYGKWPWKKDYTRTSTKRVDFETDELVDIKPEKTTAGTGSADETVK